MHTEEALLTCQKYLEKKYRQSRVIKSRDVLLKSLGYLSINRSDYLVFQLHLLRQRQFSNGCFPLYLGVKKKNHYWWRYNHHKSQS